MRKELTTKERNELIGLAVDVMPDKYNEALNFMYDNIDTMCNGNKSDCRILAAIVCVSTIDGINHLDKYDCFDGGSPSSRFGVYRWGRIVGEESWENTDGEKVEASLHLYKDEDKAKEEFAKIIG